MCCDKFCSGCVVVSVQFTQPMVQVNENEGVTDICVQKNLQTIVSVTVDLVPRNGSAIGNRIGVVVYCID